EQVAISAVPGEVLEVFADLEHPEVLVSLEILEREDVPAEKAPHVCLLPPVNRTATCLLSAAPTSSRPAKPADPVWSTSIPVADRASSLAFTRVGSSTTIGSPPLSNSPATTSYQSYVSSSRIPVATLFGSSSQGHMNSDRWVRA